MTSRLFAASLLIVAACSGPADAPQQTAGAQAGAGQGWSISVSGDLNDFFDCLEAQGAALVSAHRGGPRPGYPENAKETFAKTVSDIPAILEIDVATSADGVLYLMHDDDLARTTTGSGPADGLSWSEIKDLRLEDENGKATDFTPPTLAETLAWANGRTVVQIDFKKTTRYEDVIAEVNRQGANDRVIYIAYTMAQAERLHRLAPDAMISLSLGSQSDLNRAVAAGVPADRLLGFTGIDDPRPRLFSLLNNRDVEVIFGTLGGRQSIDNDIAQSGDEAFYATLAGMGVDIIATDRPLAAQAALDAAGRGAKSGQCGVARTG
ncbi:MAG: glycerophosphodiester phosphodiesterase family protein [Parvularculaceae bacterium]|nr:glycerophosphodiester phosphodiesterase family protein [Parvularculaceae bacterium]